MKKMAPVIGIPNNNLRDDDLELGFLSGIFYFVISVRRHHPL